MVTQRIRRLSLSHSMGTMIHRIETGPNFKLVIRFIRSLVNVQRVRFITNEHRVDQLLQVKAWREVISECVRLDRVVIQLVNDEGYTREAHTIEQELRRFRSGITFRIGQHLVQPNALSSLEKRNDDCGKERQWNNDQWYWFFE